MVSKVMSIGLQGRKGERIDGAMLLAAIQELTDYPLTLVDSICVISSLSLHHVNG